MSNWDSENNFLQQGKHLFLLEKRHIFPANKYTIAERLFCEHLLWVPLTLIKCSLYQLIERL